MTDVDLSAFPRPPRLSGGCRPTEWLRSSAVCDRKTKANFRAAEAEKIADWLDEVGKWFNAANKPSERTGA